ncbi:hypothetical protein [Patiriisocius sp. Uisw_017]|jgi:hypothetical protein|uniref:hypothetical protein n=1 Tax=Patiriisocius sp. Uisw_017 TaxID=3230968 RepID=UPI0039E9B5BA
MSLHKIFKIIGLVLSLAGVVLLAIIVAKGDDAIRDSGGEGLDGFLYVAYITMVIICVIVLLFVIKGVFAGDIKKTLISLGGVVLIFIISYFLAEGTESFTKDGELVTAQTSKYIGAGLYAFYIMAILAIGSMLFGGAKKLISK